MTIGSVTLTEEQEKLVQKYERDFGKYVMEVCYNPATGVHTITIVSPDDVHFIDDGGGMSLEDIEAIAALEPLDKNTFTWWEKPRQ